LQLGDVKNVLVADKNIIVYFRIGADGYENGAIQDTITLLALDYV
jgi:hypothetical protein